MSFYIVPSHISAWTNFGLRTENEPLTYLYRDLYTHMISLKTKCPPSLKMPLQYTNFMLE